MRKRLFGWRRIGVLGLVGASALVALGDRGQTQVSTGGIDPLEILNLQVRANAIIVLDSSGSMREMPDADLSDGQPDTPVEGEVVGDDPTSKLLGAKDVLRAVIAANETKVSFSFGRYVQDVNSYGPEAVQRFLYTTSCSTADAACNTAANSILVSNSGGSGCNSASCNSGLYRLVSDRRTIPGVAPAPGITYYHLFANKFFNGERVNVRQNGAFTTAAAAAGIVSDAGDFGPASPPPNGPGPWVEVQNLSATGTPGTLLGTPVRFMFRGMFWNKGNNTSFSCGGFDPLVGLAPCTDNVQIDVIGPHLDKELELTATGNIVGYTNQAVGGTPGAPQRPPLRGIRASGLTPIAESLIDLKNPIFTNLWTGSISTMTPVKPRTFVIFVTDGDDSCTSATTADTTPGAAADARALRAAHKAQQLYTRINALEPASSVTTFVVSFGSGASSVRSDWIAWGGSGMNQPVPFGAGATIPITGTGAAARWSRAPTPAERIACTTCQDAFVATDVADLTRMLQAAIDQGQSTGEFSDQQSITESIFELVQTVPVVIPSPPASPVPSPNPSDPQTRYSSSLPVLLQSTFEMPEFRGHLKAFRNNAGASLPMWDAGAKLRDRVNGIIPPATMPPTVPWSNRTFAQLCGSAAVAPGAATACTNANDPNFATLTPGPVIKRRIYSTSRNGVFVGTAGSATPTTDTQVVNDLTSLRFTPPDQIALWPPQPAGIPGKVPIDPVYTTPGPLDVAMGLACVTGTPVPPPVPPAVGPPACGKMFTALQTEFGACTASVAANLPIPCRTPLVAPTTAASQLAFAIKEARQIVLAHAAGANLVKTGASAVRVPTSAICPAPGNCLQFSPRPWVMAESTLAASAVVTPPLQSLPSAHQPEYKLYRDGPRTPADMGAQGLVNGFGLRNPDLDADPITSGANASLKPVMSVIYHGSNHMVHAFRAGFQSASATGVCTASATNECGGEELWAFVPFDQLSKLEERTKPQARNPHTYVVATPIRVTDIFVPGDFTMSSGGQAVSGAGVWRTAILFGRGIAGKYLTAIDITAPGRFNELSLSTAPPIVLWSRGNPDTTLGFPVVGTPATNVYNNNAADFTAYTGMGQTWSVPAITWVTAARNTTTRRSQGVEFVAFSGSGYSATATEGTTIYTLDMLSGDVVRSSDINDRTPLPGYQNALVASAAAYNPKQLRPGFIGNPAGDKSTHVYIPDIHGRIWRVLADPPPLTNPPPLLFADAGEFQPFGNPVALVAYKGSGSIPKPHVFAESGNENRIFPPPTDTPPFRMFGLRDDDLTSDPNNAPNLVAGPAWELFVTDFPNGFRGTVQPATAFGNPDPLTPNQENARVFFAGTRFNPPNTPNAPTPVPPCRSSFDSVLFAVGAETGGAAYDLNASGDDRSIQLNQQRIQAVRVSGGRLVVDTGLSAQNAPPPPAPPTVNPPVPSTVGNVLVGPPLNADGTSKIPGLVAYKVNSSVCR